MLKWILGISALIAVAVAAVVYSPSFLLVPDAREVVMDDNTRRFCKTFFKDNALMADVTTTAQHDATCLCFASDVMEKAGPSGGDMNDAAFLQEISGIAPTSIKKCVNKAELN